MGARRLGRERALQALYQLEQDTQLTVPIALDAAWGSAEAPTPKDPIAVTFAEALVNGVRSNLAEIDQLIESHSTNWRVDRMHRIDRNVLRIGVFELKHRNDIPKNVTINEAIELGKAFGNEASSSFINGLLDKVAVTVGKS